MTDDADPIAYIDRLALCHFQVGIGCELGGFVTNLLGARALGTWLFSVGILAVLGSITLRVIEYVAKRHDVRSGPAHSFRRASPSARWRSLPVRRSDCSRGYDNAVDVDLEVHTEDGRAFLLIRGGDETARAVAQGAIKVICDERGLMLNFEG